ncbi:MAG: PIN domain-containing protein [Myxococcales bacterium]|nr:PIN domain-containing protein [Myxococcales bacterium]
MKAVFIDTGAFVALVDRDDERHGRAKRLLKDLARKGRPLVTSTYIVDETLTLLRLRVGHAVAVGFGERLLSARWCRVLEVDAPVRAAAWELFVRYDDQVFSFTDCTSFALMQSMELGEAFAFDGDFAAAGFLQVPVR